MSLATKISASMSRATALLKHKLHPARDTGELSALPGPGAEGHGSPHPARIAGIRRPYIFGLLLPALLTLTVAGIVVVGGQSGSIDRTVLAASSSATFAAAEDTYVRSASPDKNYGDRSTIQADGRPEKWGLVRFQVSGLPTSASISSARLRMYVIDGSRDAVDVYTVSGQWSEATTTWENAPALGGKVAAFATPLSSGRWAEVDVTSAVKGNGSVSFYLLSVSSNGVDFASSETSNVPELIVQWSDSASAPAPTATASPTPTPTQSASPTPTPTPSGGSSFQPAPPITAAFFYPWFPNAWSQGGVYPFTNFTPSLGYYDSKDNAIIDEQLRLASRAHIEAFIASWWGQGHHTDTAFQHILARSERSDSPYQDLRWAIYYEEEGYSDPSVSKIVSDLNYLADRVFSHPGYLRVNNRPVVFVYADSNDGSGMADRWARAKAQFGGNVYIVLKVYSGYTSDPNQPDSWHQYGPAVAYDSQLPYSVSVSPGFWLKGESQRLSRDPARFESDVQRMASSGAFWQLITTWNEWGEGTIVEPAEEFSNTYIDILCRNLPGSTSCGGGSGTSPSPTPAPTATPTPTATPPSSGTTFSFSAAGDIGATSATNASLSLLKGMELSFFLALGDMSYEDITPESGWCSYIKSYLGSTFPFQIVAGNHEDDDRVDGWIGNFDDCLPDRMNSTGVYAAQYYFDYPSSSPLARVIMISPGLEVFGVSYNYNKGGSHYNWLVSAIDDARARGIPWVIVGMHKACITMGNKPCEIGQDLVDLLTSKKVDLVLQAHDHDYQRSKQLTCAVANSYVNSCVADDGSDGHYVKDRGTVFVIAGMFGGGGLTTLNLSDSEARYFAAWMGNNSSSENHPDGPGGRGVVIYEVSADRIEARFIGSTTSYSDSFVIEK